MKKVEKKLTFIGTGGGRVVLSNQTRSLGGFVIQTKNSQIHVDPGPGALSNAVACKIKPSNTNIVICTHEHIDHANDVNAIIKAVTMGGIKKGCTLISVPSVIEGGTDIPWLRNEPKKHLDNIFSIDPGDVVKYPPLQITGTKTKHDSDNCIGIKIEGPNISIGYTSDTSYFKELNKEFKGVAVLIINVLRPGKEKWKTHMCTADAIKLIENVQPELAVISHFGQKMLNSDPMVESREIQRKTGVRTIAAKDGLQVNLDGLAEGKGIQTTL